MNNSEVIAFALLVLLAVTLMLVFRWRAKLKVKGPFGVSAELDGSNQPNPGVRGEGLYSRAGGIEATDKTGKGVELTRSSAQKDIHLTNEAPPGGPQPPKL